MVGTVLSLWDAAELDAANPGKDVVPTFLNLTDASIKMVRGLTLSICEFVIAGLLIAGCVD